jgi:hypothetical protein
MIDHRFDPSLWSSSKHHTQGSLLGMLAFGGLFTSTPF